MKILIRHFTEQDVPLRTALLHEDSFQANLTDFAVTTGDDELTRGQLRTIAEQQDTKRIYTATRADGQVIGFLWVTDLDWRSQCCELSFALLPRYRGGFGPPTINAARGYLYDELNMQVVIDQVLEHNTMLHSSDEMQELSRVRCAYDSYTVGSWRTARFWTRRVAAFREWRAAEQRRRVDLSARIRSAIEEGT
ncbi:GNAT family N-acetyltransferase [Actinacidiphila sp. ITFR-21]|uniref:GNAT family N-acetyltransferase n=1 Tax=Actinacidiphila sp. ITFR-21 TaxID=3075199 RepID=UPI00288BBB71|nr:GNAT family N-acetyltransferase [Streptomyces sp. ITFR-21]WNI18962.1 GNAT family N-acetyltransferase [Streptomyces sp. ITFR-21]